MADDTPQTAEEAVADFFARHPDALKAIESDGDDWDGRYGTPRLATEWEEYAGLTELAPGQVHGVTRLGRCRDCPNGGCDDCEVVDE